MKKESPGLPHSPSVKGCCIWSLSFSNSSYLLLVEQEISLLLISYIKTGACSHLKQAALPSLDHSED